MGQLLLSKDDPLPLEPRPRMASRAYDDKARLFAPIVVAALALLVAVGMARMFLGNTRRVPRRAATLAKFILCEWPPAQESLSILPYLTFDGVLHVLSGVGSMFGVKINQNQSVE